MLGYDEQLKELVAAYPDADLLELGAGRRPSFTFSELPNTVRSYTVNDISEEELALLPEGYEKACFDVSGDAKAFSDKYDVVFSRFLAEHVPDGEAMHRNVFQVLKPGGVTFHLIPTLYALPFVINKLLPERVTAKILAAFAPRRAINPKFPAYYSACYGNSDRMTELLKGIGYSQVEIRSFYGHFYYEKIPGLKQIHEQFSALAADRDWADLSSYAYIIARK